jgi:hypothetical protein
MKTPWFKPWGWLYLPVSAPGFFATLLPLAFAVNVFLAVDRRSHSVSDTLYGIFPFWVPTFLLWVWLAARTSEPKTRNEV